MNLYEILSQHNIRTLLVGGGQIYDIAKRLKHDELEYRDLYQNNRVKSAMK